MDKISCRTEYLEATVSVEEYMETGPIKGMDGQKMFFWNILLSRYSSSPILPGKMQRIWQWS